MGYRGSSDLFVDFRQVFGNAFLCHVARVLLPYDRKYAAAPEEPVTVCMKVTKDEEGTQKLVEEALSLNPCPDREEAIDLWQQTRELLAGGSPVALTVPPYNWRERWPTGWARITHLLPGAVVQWKEDLPPGTELFVDVSVRRLQGTNRWRRVPASKYAIYTEDDLLRPKPREEPDAGPEPLALDLRKSDTIQGNVLAGFNKPQQAFLFLRFGNAERAREWLGKLVARITTTAEVAKVKDLLRQAREQGLVDRADVWMNLGLTFEGLCTMEPELQAGLRHLEEEPRHEEIADFRKGIKAFRQGPSQRAEALGDTGDSAPKRWAFGRDDQPTVHAVLTIAADKAGDLEERIGEQAQLAEDHEIELVFAQRCAALPGAAKGHEHFGFRDGVSQPGVRGYSRPAANNADEDADHPGARIVAREHFVLEEHPLRWMKDGSFQVLRRLAQDVRAWRGEVNSRSATLGQDEELGTGMFGARLVGRWPSGTSTRLAVTRDFRPTERDRDNLFDHRDDPDGLRTPSYAHARTQNPRKDPAEDDQHRILRRGIPYGPPFDPETEGGDRADDKRGLLFNAFMADLTQQFEHLQKKANAAAQAVPDALLSGPTKDGRFEFRRVGEKEPRTFDLHRFVRTRGALYAFAPSIPVLRALAGNRREELGLDNPCPVCGRPFGQPV